MFFQVHVFCLSTLILISNVHGLFNIEDNPPLIDKFVQVVWDPSSLIRWWTGLDQMYQIALGWRRAARSIAALPFREGRSMSHVRIKEPRTWNSVETRSSDVPHWERFNRIYSTSTAKPIEIRSRIGQKTAASDVHQNHIPFRDEKNNEFHPPAGILGSGFSVIDTLRNAPFHDANPEQWSSLFKPQEVFTNYVDWSDVLAYYEHLRKNNINFTPSNNIPVPEKTSDALTHERFSPFDRSSLDVQRFQQILDVITKTEQRRIEKVRQDALRHHQNQVDKQNLENFAYNQFLDALSSKKQSQISRQPIDNRRYKLPVDNLPPNREREKTSALSFPVRNNLPVPLMFFNNYAVPSANPQNRLNNFLTLMKQLGEQHISKVKFDD